MDDLPDRAAAAERLLQLRATLSPDTEPVAVDDVAGRTLAEPVDAPVDLPGVDRATMDGVALAAGDSFPLRVVGSVGPEDDPPSLSPGEAVRIATGAALPARADAVLRREDAELEDDRLAGPPATAGQHVYRRGTNVTAGERLFAAGERLAPRDAALLSDLGVESVTVRDRLSVGVLATGTEIHEGRQPDRDTAMLLNLARAWGADAAGRGTVPDEYERVRERVGRLAAEHDVVLTSGGTSVGRGDHVTRALADLGEVLVPGVAVRPGRPATAARLDREDAVVLALPGKPVAAHTAALVLGRPLLTGETALPALGATAAVDLAVPERPGMEYAVPVALADGRATPYGHPESPLALFEERFRPGRLASATRATRADGLVLTEEGFAAGEGVSVVPYEVQER
jgi:molybdopterin molybdotransferase